MRKRFEATQPKLPAQSDAGVQMVQTEAQLSSLAYRLIGQDVLTRAEQHLVERLPDVPTALVETARRAIKAGNDPLGEYFCRLRSPELRRKNGATYTPPAIVTAMISWALHQPTAPVRVVDPGSGSGRFLLAAAKAFPIATLVAAETDPLALLLLRANANVNGFSDRLKVHCRDYRSLTLPPVNGPTLFIGNPPYVRHHDISELWKDWFAKTAVAYGLRASKLAGLHIHFFLKTRTLGGPGDYGAFITSAEWIDVNYGSILREMLADGLGGTSLHVIDPAARPFADALTTGAITCFEFEAQADHFTVGTVDSLEALGDLSYGVPIKWSALAAAPRWSVHIRKSSKPAAGDIELGELFQVHRGQVTGANSIWIAGPFAKGLPKRLLLPCVTRARELLAADDALTSVHALRRVIDLPVDLDTLTPNERAAVDSYLDWARKLGTHKGYVASNRRAWWAVGLKDPAPILCTYMARRAPAFVRNLCGARHLNIAHGLYPREPLDEALLEQLLAFLKGNVCINAGRIYAGGLAKFEPGEVERLTIPSLERLREIVP